MGQDYDVTTDQSQRWRKLMADGISFKAYTIEPLKPLLKEAMSRSVRLPSRAYFFILDSESEIKRERRWKRY